MCGKFSKVIRKVNMPLIEKCITKQGKDQRGFNKVKEIIKDNTKIKFNKYSKFLKVPFIISADIECVNLHYQGCDQMNDKRLSMINKQINKEINI